MNLLRGFVPALLTPFTKDGERVDYEALERLAAYLLSSGVGGVFVTGTTGEFISLSPDERRRVIAEATELFTGKTTVVAHVGSYNTAEAVSLTRFAVEHGVDAVASLPPYFYGMDDSAQFQYFGTIARNAGDTPVFLYNLPQCACNAVSLELIPRLKEVCPNIRGIKDSSGDVKRLEETLALGIEGFEVVCGADHLTQTALKLGCRASVTSTGNAFPEAFGAVYDAFETGDDQAATEAQSRLTALTEVLLGGRLVATYKASLALKGVDVGTVRPPQRRLAADELSAMKKGLTELKFIQCGEHRSA